MAYADLGKKIKAKYPEYQDMDDIELGKRMVQKYPEYSDFADDNDRYEISRTGVKTTPDMNSVQKFMAGFTQASQIPMQNQGVSSATNTVGDVSKVGMPIMGNIIGRGVYGKKGAIAGTGMGELLGTITQEAGQSFTGTQDESPSELLKKTIADPAKAMVIATLLEGVTGVAQKGKHLAGMRNKAAEKATGSIKADNVLERIVSQAENAPVTDKAAVEKYVLKAIEEYSGKTYSVSEAVLKKQLAGDAGWTATKAGKGGKAFVERAIASAFREEIQQVAPNVTKLDALLRANMQLNKTLSKTATQGLKVGGAVTGLYAIGRMLGLGK